MKLWLHWNFCLIRLWPTRWELCWICVLQRSRGTGHCQSATKTWQHSGEETRSKSWRSLQWNSSGINSDTGTGLLGLFEDDEIFMNFMTTQCGAIGVSWSGWPMWLRFSISICVEIPASQCLFMELPAVSDVIVIIIDNSGIFFSKNNVSLAPTVHRPRPFLFNVLRIMEGISFFITSGIFWAPRGSYGSVGRSLKVYHNLSFYHGVHGKLRHKLKANCI